MGPREHELLPGAPSARYPVHGIQLAGKHSFEGTPRKGRYIYMYEGGAQSR